MNKVQQKRYDSLYQKHLSVLKRQGKSKATIDGYSRAVRRITCHFDRCPDRLSVSDLKDYFASLIETHSWSTVKLDRCGLQFFYKHVLGENGSGLILLNHLLSELYRTFSPRMSCH